MRRRSTPLAAPVERAAAAIERPIGARGFAGVPAVSVADGPALDTGLLAVIHRDLQGALLEYLPKSEIVRAPGRALADAGDVLEDRVKEGARSASCGRRPRRKTVRTGRPARRRRRAGALAALALLLAAIVPRFSIAANEYELKAGFLYNFLKYVEWPAAAFEPTDGVVVVGLLVREDLRDDLADSFAGKIAEGRRIGVRRVSGPEDVSPCQVLFVGAADEWRWPMIARQIANRPILTVGETSEFLRHGGMIAFVEEDEKLRFEIDYDAVQRSGLQMSSQLLKLARRVIGSPGLSETPP